VTGVALQTRGLKKRFGALTALRGIDLDVSRGTIHAILGPNGAGKSTLLKILAGLAQPSEGKVEIKIGKAPLEPRKARHTIGYVGHTTLLYPELTASENLVFAGRLFGVRDPELRAQVLLEEEGLSEVAERRAGTFSRGMAQRLSIARSRVHAPEILLLDEPFTGLDRRSADALAKRLLDLRDSGHALVLITHDLRRAGEIADRADTLIRGTVVQHIEGDDLTSESLESAYLALDTSTLNTSTLDTSAGDAPETSTGAITGPSR
jgi:ABC-type multidrug transport system ATPase subunit